MAIPPMGQDFMLQQSGVSWEIQTFDTGHAPFLSQPRGLSAWTDSQIARFHAREGLDDVATS